MMTEEVAKYLLTEAGRDLLAQAQTLLAERAEPLTALTRLRQSASPEESAPAWEMADLRRRAAVKFGPQAATMYFVREALEQASSARAAAYHAGRFAQAGIGTVADLCGGIGGDSLAFARAGLRVTLVERDPVRARFAAENARVHGLSERIRVINADVTGVALSAEAAWFDPARRADARRKVAPEDYTPPLSFLNRLQAEGIADRGVKLSPAIDHAVAAQYDAELEFLSDGGECKEALLWLGALRTGDRMRATVLTDAGSVWLTGRPDDALPAPLPLREGLKTEASFLYEPDPAIIRAHLVGTLARTLGAAPLDPQIAYLVGGELAATPFAAAYEILDRFPYSRKRLQEALSARDVGRVVIKKRGFPLEPDAVRKLLKLRGTREMTVILTRAADRHQAILCRPAPARG